MTLWVNNSLTLNCYKSCYVEHARFIINLKYSKELFTEVEVNFSNSLIIHQAKTKEITSVKEVWIPDLN